MFVCSCNVLSDHALLSAVASADKPPRVSQMYACLGCKVRCGRCAGAIRRIMDEVRGCVTDGGGLLANDLRKGSAS
jgi:bacterioferritin-associated ferredoxin